MDTAEKDTVNVDVQNYLRLQYLLNSVTNNFLRNWFSKSWVDSGNSEWMNKVANGTEFVDGIGSTLYNSSQGIQKKHLKTGNINVWDLPLLIDAVKCVQPSASKDFRKDFENLKKSRNELAHLGSLEISDEQFNKFWSDISKTLLSLGIKQDDLDKAKTFKVQAEPEENLNAAIDRKAEELKNNGNEFFKQKQFAKAIISYSEAILLPDLPNNYLATLYANRSIAYLKTKELQNAKDDAKGAIHLRPNWWKGYVRLAKSYDEMKSYDKALKYYDIALGFEPDAQDIKNGRDFCRHMINKKKGQQHMDPANYVKSFQEMAESINKQGGRLTSAYELEAKQKLSYKMGEAAGISAEGQNYLFGRGVTQNYEMAATLFSKAAGMGNPEGLYYLAMVTTEGKGVKRDVYEAVQMLLKAAEQEPFKEPFAGCGFVTQNPGVMEAQHALGLSYETGVGVPLDYKEAIVWYEKALENGNADSANNLAIMYLTEKGVNRNIEKSFQYSKVAAVKGTVRTMENLADNYVTIDLKTAQKWYTIAVQNGSVSLPLRKAKFMFDKFPMAELNTDEFLENVKQELMRGPMKKFFKNEDKGLDAMQKSFSRLLGKEETDTSSNEFRTKIIIKHREIVKQYASRGEKQYYAANPPKLQPKAIPDLIGLKPIFFKDMNQREDHIYNGFAIKLTTIEDVPLTKTYVSLIGQDENGDVHRIFIHNYPKSEKVEESFSYGTRITIVNPYFRITDDCYPAIRVDDPSLLFINKLGKDPNRCRYCGKAQGTVPCRTCRRVYYCSKLCLKNDSEFLQHRLICKKRL